MVRETSDQRGDTTRHTILHTAIEMFAEAGFEGVSTRALAARAGVNQPAIQYHFDSKDGLYRAAIQWIADDLEEQVHDLHERIQAGLSHDPVDPEQAKALLLDLMDRFIDICLNKQGRESWSSFIARAEIENHPALAHFSDVIGRTLIEPCAALLAVVMRRNRDDQDVILLGMALFGMVTTFKNRCVNSSIWQILKWTAIGPDQVASIKSVLREQTNAILAAAEARAS